MATNWLTDEGVEKEIARLSESEYVKPARKELPAISKSADANWRRPGSPTTTLKP